MASLTLTGFRVPGITHDKAFQFQSAARDIVQIELGERFTQQRQTGIFGCGSGRHDLIEGCRRLVRPVEPPVAHPFLI